MSNTENKTIIGALICIGISLFPLTSRGKPILANGEKPMSSEQVSNAIVQRFIDGEGQTIAYLNGPEIVVFNFSNGKRVRIKNSDSGEKFADFREKIALSPDGRLLAVVVRPENGNKGHKTYIAIVNLQDNSIQKIDVKHISATSLYFSPDSSNLYFATDINDVVNRDSVQVFDDGDYSYLNKLSLSDYSISHSNLIYDYVSIAGFSAQNLVVTARGVYPDLSSEERTGNLTDGIQFNDLVASKKYLYNHYKRPSEVEPKSPVITDAVGRNYFYQIDLKKFPDLDKIELFAPDNFYTGVKLLEQDLNSYVQADETGKAGLYANFSSRFFEFSDDMQYKFIVDGFGAGSNAWCQDQVNCVEYPKVGYSYVLSRNGKYLNVQRVDGMQCVLSYGQKLESCNWINVNSVSATELSLSI